MKNGNIYLVTLDPTIGSEQSKTRPCIIISTDIVNDYAKTVTIAPLSHTIRTKPFPFHVKVGEGVCKIEQLRTVDKSRLQTFVGTINSTQKNAIKKALALYFELI